MRKKGNFTIFSKNEENTKSEKNGPKLKKKGYMVFREKKKKQRKKKRKKENGAHKHLSHCKKLRAQNIHVMLSYANNPQTKKNKTNK